MTANIKQLKMQVKRFNKQGRSTVQIKEIQAASNGCSAIGQQRTSTGSTSIDFYSLLNICILQGKADFSTRHLEYT